MGQERDTGGFDAVVSADPYDPADLGLILPKHGDVVPMPPATCCGIEWHSDAVRLGKQPDGRNVGWSRTGRCGVCLKSLVREA